MSQRDATLKYVLSVRARACIRCAYACVYTIDPLRVRGDPLRVRACDIDSVGAYACVNRSPEAHRGKRVSPEARAKLTESSEPVSRTCDMTNLPDATAATVRRAAYARSERTHDP